MQTLLTPLAAGWAAAAAAMAVLWTVQRRTGNAGIVDVAWAALTGVLGVAFAAAPTGVPWLRGLAAAMIGGWSLRLTAYLFRRVVGHPEEGRYRTLRQQWGANADRRFFWFFQMQAAAAVWFAAPALAIAVSRQAPSVWLIGLAVALWVIGVGGVTIADRQLARFKSRGHARGRTCREGLWRYSRHPNYFFEWLHWCSYVPLATGSVVWWVPVAVAATLLYLLLFVTGIPPTEAQALATRGDDYREYQRTTSAFIPWLNKRASGVRSQESVNSPSADS